MREELLHLTGDVCRALSVLVCTPIPTRAMPSSKCVITEPAFSELKPFAHWKPEYVNGVVQALGFQILQTETLDPFFIYFVGALRVTSSVQWSLVVQK